MRQPIHAAVVLGLGHCVTWSGCRELDLNLRSCCKLERMETHDTRTAADVIIEEVTSWPGVETGPGNFGAVQFRLGKRELGHLHGDTLADIPFTKAIRDDLLARGEIVRHRPLPDSGWGSRHIRNEDDVRAVIELLRMQYERARAARRT